MLSFVIRFALSRSREFLADAGSVELTKNPDAMISALRKIEGRGELPGATSAVMEMCVDNPREGFGELFDTHPVGRQPRRRAGPICRRTRSRPARAAAAARMPTEPQNRHRPPAHGQSAGAGRPMGRHAETVARGSGHRSPSCRPHRQSNSAAAISHRTGPWGPKQGT